MNNSNENMQEKLNLEVLGRVEEEERQKLPDTSKQSEGKVGCLFNVDVMHVVQLGFDLNMLYLLERAYIAPLKTEFCANPKIKAWEQTLIRKGLITVEGEITEEGKKVYGILSSSSGEVVAEYKKEKKEKVEKVKSDFDRWWDTYPSTDNFVYKNKQFKGSRSMKVKKADCMNKFREIIAEGKWKADDIIAGTFNHMEIAKEDSYRRGENKLSYIANSERYLRERMFEGFIKGVQVKPKNMGSIDI